jgi:diguanylate cyclase (GGDEF)-like protein
MRTMTPTALVVEDDHTIRHLVRAALTAEGHNVVEAADGQTALTTAADVRPDIILLDIGLPDIDGLTVLQELKQNPALRSIPVVMVTAWTDPEYIRLAMDRGAADYICKPFSVDDLLSRVEAARRPPAPAPVAAINDRAVGLPGEAHLTTVLEAQVMATRRTGRPFAIVLVEIDGVDALIAEHGKEVSDDLLRAAAKRMRQRAGVSDVIVRYSTYALALVIPGADAELATARAEALRATLAEGPLDTPTAGVAVTASFGVAAHEPAEHPDETLGRAAEALIAAKDAGTDSVVCDEPVPPAA